MALDFFKLTREKPMSVMYTHVEPSTGEQTHIAVSEIESWLKVQNRKPALVPLDPSMARHFERMRGLEPHRLNRLTRATATVPVLFLHMPDKTWLLADGNHRYVWLARAGYKSLLGYLVEEHEWRPYEIYNVPLISTDEMLKSFSGIR